MRRVLVLALLGALSGCASKAPQPSAAVSPSAPASSAAVRPASATADQSWMTLNPRLSPRAFCFETRGVWRAAAGNCEYESPD